MTWLAENWIIVLLIGGMGAFHLFGHKHGGQGGGHGGGQGGGHGGGHGKADKQHTAHDQSAEGADDTGAPSRDA